MFILFLILIETSKTAKAIQSDFFDYSLEKKDSYQYFQALEIAIKRSLQRKPDSWKLYWKLARAQYYLGNRSKAKKEKRGLYSLCIKNTNRSIELNPKSAGGNYFHAICSGKMGELNGVWSSLSMIDEFRNQMHFVIQLDPNFEFGGPHRALGKYLHDLPFFLGGNLKQSIKHLKLAVQFGPEYSDNYYYLAESLFDAEEYEAAESVVLIYLEKSLNEKAAFQKRERAEKFLQQIKTNLRR